MFGRTATWVTTTIAILALCLLPISVAQAAPVSGGTLQAGAPVQGTVSTADGIAYTFTAVQGRHLTLDVTTLHVSTGKRLQLNVYNSSGATDVSGQVFSTAVTDLDFTPTAAQAGATTVVISPYDSGATGTFTLTYALDVTGTLVSGTPVNGALMTGGQRTAYTFTAVLGKHVTLAVTNPQVDPLGTRLQINVYNSSGAADVSGAVFSAARTELDFTPTTAAQAGLTTVVISPYDFESVGSFTLTYVTDLAGALTSGTPVTGTLAAGGQRTAYTFTAVAGKHVTLAITNPHLDPPGARLQLNVYNSSGATDVSGTVFSTAWTEIDFTPTAAQAGVTTVVISPYDFEATGTFTLTYATDLTGALASGAAKTATLTYAGQQTAYTFTAVAGTPVTLAISSPHTDPGGARLQLNVYNSSGATDAGGAAFSTTPVAIHFTPSAAQAGPTTVVISRYDFETTGSFTLTYTAG